MKTDTVCDKFTCINEVIPIEYVPDLKSCECTAKPGESRAGTCCMLNIKL